MEPNNPNTQQGRGTQPPPKSPPQPGASMQPTSAAGNEQRSEPNAETGSAESGASEFAVEMKNAAKAKVKEGTDNAKRAVTSTVSHGSEALGRAADTLRDQGKKRWLRQPPPSRPACLNTPNDLKNVPLKT